MIECGAEQTLRIDSSGCGGAKGRVERGGVTTAGGIEHGIDGAGGIVADKQFDVLSFDPPCLGGIKAELFQLASRDLRDHCPKGSATA